MNIEKNKIYYLVQKLIACSFIIPRVNEPPINVVNCGFVSA